MVYGLKVSDSSVASHLVQYSLFGVVYLTDGIPGRTFRGLLFTGIMITRSGPKVLEYNVRFGDPETQTMMLLLSQNTDLATVLLACTQGTLKDAHLGVRSGYACNVVISSAGYPGPYSTGKPIRLNPILPPDVQISHAGTKLIGDVLHTDWGRVFSVAAYGDSLEDAVKGAYQGVEAISFQGMHFRTDIASQYVIYRIQLKIRIITHIGDSCMTKR